MKNYKEILELHKILEMLENQASNDRTKELIRNIKPSDDIYIVRKENKKVSDAFELSVKFGTPEFINYKDIVSSLKRAESGAKLSLKELIEIARVLYQIRTLTNWYAQCDGLQSELDYLFSTLTPNKYLEDRIKTCIIDETTVSDNASAELASIRKKIVSNGGKIKQHLDKMIKSASTQKYLQENIVTMRDGRYVVPVKSEFKNEVSGLVHDTSSTGSTYFIEPIAIVEANNEIRILKGQEQDEINRIIAELSMECGDFKDSIIQSYEICSELNMYFAKANLAAKMNAVMPVIREDGKILLHKARHPLIEAKKVVPIDVNIGYDFKTLIITGPNTGGKTVILKTVGLLTLMTMCGILIPVSDGSEISVFEHVLVDIGDQQSIEQSLSTFSSHMNRVIDILAQANDKSLVLLDELGSGTDPVEGSALAISIIESLKNKGAEIITTTHYQELKMYAIETSEVENASCEFDIKTLQPTYNLIIGSPGKSNAFAISLKLGLEESIIDYAKNLISEENMKFENIMQKLEDTRMELEENNRVAEKAKREAIELKNKLDIEYDKLESDKDNQLQRARNEATRIVDNVRRQSNAIIDELDDIRKQKEKDNFSQMAINVKSKNKSAMDRLYLEANPVTETNSTYKLPRALIIGDSVIINDTKKSATVLSLPDNNGNLFVQAGIMKTKINVSKLRLSDKPKVTYNNKKIVTHKSTVSTKGVESRATRKVQMELDIRGYACDEGIMETDTFLDKAVLSGLNLVTIIHGKGTGVLKNAIRNHLKNHPLVKSSRRGLYGEGEDGVTVVELK